MAVKTGLDLRQTQRLTLTPDLKQGLVILQMPTADLLIELHRQSEDNPLIEVADPLITPSGAPADGVEPQIAKPETLADSLRKQLSLMPLTPTVAALAQFLVGDLDDDGYLSGSVEETVADLGADEADIKAAITALQGCEPVGVGARSLTECLALQLIDKGVAPELAHGACAHLQPLMEGRWSRSLQKLGISRLEIEALANLIRTLSPRPAAEFSPAAQIMIPEIMVESDGQGGFLALPSFETVPLISLDKALTGQLGDIGGPLRDRLQEAERLMRALRFRTKTLADVARVILKHQHPFFSKGPDHLQPLTRAQIAQELGLHASTVGRAIAGKALSFHGETHPLARFLSPRLSGQDGKEVSAFRAQRLVRRAIDAEAADSPLSDEEIASFLRREGVDIARRTVAKYRGCLNIPSSFERKRRNSKRSAGSAPKGLGSP